MTSIGENYPIDASKTTVNGKFPEVFIDDIIIEDPGSNYQEGDSISDDIRPVIETNPESPNRGRIVAIEIVNQIPYNRNTIRPHTLNRNTQSIINVEYILLDRSEKLKDFHVYYYS